MSNPDDNEIFSELRRLKGTFSPKMSLKSGRPTRPVSAGITFRAADNAVGGSFA